MSEQPATKKGFIQRLREAFFPVFWGSASPKSQIFSETPEIPLKDVMTLYERDPVCKASVDLLASSVGVGFYTTVNEEYEKAKEAKQVVDDFNAEVNLDGLLNDMAKTLIACGNDFWLKISPDRLENLHRIPIDSVVDIKRKALDSSLNIPYAVESYVLDKKYASNPLKPEAVIHWHINRPAGHKFGIGLLQVLLHTLTVQSDRRQSYISMKAKIEKAMPKIFEKYAGPDVLVNLPNAKEETIRKFETAIRNRPEEGAWLFYTGKDAKLEPVTIDPRARFEYYVDHIINQFYLGCETPLPRLYSTPGFTEASAKTSLELQDMILNPLKRYIKRQVEREIFAPVLRQAGFDPLKAQVRLNWGMPKAPEVKIEHIIELANISAQTGVAYIRPEEVRKNLVKFGVELWEPEKAEETPVIEKRKVKSQWLLQKLE